MVPTRNKTKLILYLVLFIYQINKNIRHQPKYHLKIYIPYHKKGKIDKIN